MGVVLTSPIVSGMTASLARFVRRIGANMEYSALSDKELPLHVRVYLFGKMTLHSLLSRHYVQQATTEKKRNATKRPRTLSNGG